MQFKSFSSEGSDGYITDKEEISPICKNKNVMSKRNVNEDVSADDELSIEEDSKEKTRLKKKNRGIMKVQQNLRKSVLTKQAKDCLTIEPVKSEKPTRLKTRKTCIEHKRKQLFHDRNFIPFSEETEIEADCVYDWIDVFTKKNLHDIVDLNDAEKQLMTLWNDHVIEFNFRGIKSLSHILMSFVRKHYSILYPHLYCNFVAHVSCLVQADLVSMACMTNCIFALQEHSQQNPTSIIQGELENYDPIEHLSHIFPGLELDDNSNEKEDLIYRMKNISISKDASFK